MYCSCCVAHTHYVYILLGKSKGQMLRVAAALRVIFHLGEAEISYAIREEAILTFINFVQLCCQQTAFVAGRGDISEEVEIIKASMLVSLVED